MLLIPVHGSSRNEDNIGVTSAENGVQVVADSVAHTKGATFTTLVAATTYESYGVFVVLTTGATASTRVNFLVDIAIGASTYEVVIIPNLIGGNQAASATTSLGGSWYYFPLRIAAWARLSARCQSDTGSDDVYVGLHLVQQRVPGAWYGQRVTAYGADTATSTGVSMSPGNSTYATDVSLSASTTNPIRYLQVGTDLYTNTAGSTVRGLIRVTAGTTVIATDLVYYESTTLESVMFTPANFILSHMRFNLPAGINLKISAMRNVAAATRGWALYGLD